MTTSSTPSTAVAKTRIKLDRDPGQLLAAIPHMMGFHPVESVILIGHRPTTPSVLGWMLRGDLPPAEFEAEQAEEMVARMGMSDAFGVTAVIVGATTEVDRRSRCDDVAPHTGLVEAVTEACASADLRLLHALWVPVIRAGSQWQCYQDRTCRGTVPDPASTAVAATVASTGKVTFDSREDMAGLLTADTAEALRRRSEALDMAIEELDGCGCADDGTETWPCGCAGYLARDAFHDRCVEVGAALRRTRGENPELTDEQIVTLAMAISDTRVRDACLATAVPAGSASAIAAESLWTALVRATPEPERAEAATLLGYSAYLRGDGTLAGMALRTALDCMPEHILASLLTRALEHGVPPERLEGLARGEDTVDLWQAGENG